MLSIARFGWSRDLPDHRDHLHIAPTDVLPASYDLRSLEFGMIPVYDQGDFGSCTANMGAAMAQYLFLKEALSDQSVPSRMFLYYNERVIEGTPSFDSGAQCRDALKCLSTIGSIPETLYPYTSANLTAQPPAQCYVEAKWELATEYASVPQTRDAIKQTIFSGLPVGFGFSVYSSFMSDSVAKTGMVPMPGLFEKRVGGHAVVIVGYNDDMQRYIVRNSWSALWGDKGYFYMPYNYVESTSLASDFWVLKKVD